MTIVVRDMCASEVHAVATLLLAANEEHLTLFPSTVAAAYRAELADVAGRLAVADVLVAEGPTGLVGTVTLLGDAADDSHAWPLGGAVLRLLAVDPSERGAGVGTNLSRACIERARTGGAAYLGLHTSPFMAAARSLYERLGFVRAPEHDFDPQLHYGGDATSAEPWGLAYVLDLQGDRIG